MLIWLTFYGIANIQTYIRLNVLCGGQRKVVCCCRFDYNHRIYKVLLFQEYQLDHHHHLCGLFETFCWFLRFLIL